MRIDSTDAINSVASSTVSNSQSQAATPVVTRNTGSSLEDKIHLTEFEKGELPVSEKVVLEAVERANRAVSMAGRTFEYSIHEKTKQIMIKVIDVDTKEVIREIPPEKTLDMVAKMMEMAGLLVDERR